MSNTVCAFLFVTLAASSIAHGQQQTPNADDRTMAVLWSQASLEHDVNCVQAFKLAKAKLREGLANPQWSAATEQGSDFATKRPAVILDVDETVLDNGPFNARLVKLGSAYDPSHWDRWCEEAKAEPLPGAKEFIHFAIRSGVDVFFVTNRDKKLKSATAANLALALGMTIDSGHLLLKNERPDWPSDKTSRRAFIAKTHRIVLLVGDDFNDFVALGKKNSSDRGTAGEHFQTSWGHHWILIANPMYGNWEKAVYNNDLTQSANAMLRLRHATLDTAE